MTVNEWCRFSTNRAALAFVELLFGRPSITIFFFVAFFNLSLTLVFFNPTFSRLLCRGTLEESLSRRGLQRLIIADLEAAINQNTLKKQTIEEIFNPSSQDNGYLWPEKKKKDKVRT